MPLLPRTGSILVTGSTGATQAQPGISLYCGAEAAIRQCMRSWIQDVEGSGIRINVLSLGAVDTPSVRSALTMAAGAEKVDAGVQTMAAKSPLGRLADPAGIGTAAVFLASEAVSFITGIELFVDGGMAQMV